MPLVVLTQFILILEINFALGLSSGYLCPHSIFRLYILFSYGVCKKKRLITLCVAFILYFYSRLMQSEFEHMLASLLAAKRGIILSTVYVMSLFLAVQ
jgi:hypothetical protein